MKKIPTLFKRNFIDNHTFTLTSDVTEGCNVVLEGKTLATVKIDGSCCMIKDMELYRRFDAKKGRKIPEGAIPCQEDPDHITGHFPHWVKVSEINKADKYHIQAFNTLMDSVVNVTDGTYEIVGIHFQNNPYNLDCDRLIRHGSILASISDVSFDGIGEWLGNHNVEGIVFWCKGEPLCKIRRKDYGYKWGKND